MSAQGALSAFTAHVRHLEDSKKDTLLAPRTTTDTWILATQLGRVAVRHLSAGAERGGREGGKAQSMAKANVIGVWPGSPLSKQVVTCVGSSVEDSQR